jgi:c-di-GMP-binding flagellar brake protein YcgR
MATAGDLPQFQPLASARVAVAGGAMFGSFVLAVDARHARMRLEPPHQGEFPPAGAGVQVAIEDDMHMVRFLGIVRETLLGAEGQLWVSMPEHPSGYEALRRRALLRRNLACPVVITRSLGGQLEIARGITVDIGGGGIRMRTEPALPVGEVVNLRLSLHSKEMAVKATAKVLECVVVDPRKLRRPGEDGLGYESRLVFTAIDEAARQRIIQRCFEQQVDRRRRGFGRD